MRRVLLVLLGFGVFAGYGSAIASARWHARHGGEGGCQSRWSRGYDRNDRDDAREVAAPTAAPAPQQMQASPTIVVPQAAPAPAQQIFLIMPGASTVQGQPQVITVPVPAAAPAPAQAPAPASP